MSTIGTGSVHQEVKKAPDTGNLFKIIFTRSGSPHGWYLVYGLANADTDIFSAFMPATVFAHNLFPYRDDPVNPVVVGKTHAGVF